MDKDMNNSVYLQQREVHYHKQSRYFKSLQKKSRTTHSFECRLCENIINDVTKIIMQTSLMKQHFRTTLQIYIQISKDKGVLFSSFSIHFLLTKSKTMHHWETFFFKAHSLFLKDNNIR